MDRHAELTALLARLDQEIAEAENLTKHGAEPSQRQQAKTLMEQLKLDRMAAEKIAKWCEPRGGS